MADWQGILLCFVGGVGLVSSPLLLFLFFYNRATSKSSRFRKEKRILNANENLDKHRTFSILLVEYIHLVNQSYENTYIYAKTDPFRKTIDLVRKRERTLYDKILEKNIELDKIIDNIPTLIDDWFYVSSLYDDLEETIMDGFLRPKGANRYSFGHYLDLLIDNKRFFDLYSSDLSGKVNEEVEKLEKDLKV